MGKYKGYIPKIGLKERKHFIKGDLVTTAMQDENVSKDNSYIYVDYMSYGADAVLQNVDGKSIIERMELIRMHPAFDPGQTANGSLIF